MKKVKKIGNYNLIKVIGSGATGKVKLGEHIETGEKVAVKIIPRVDSIQSITTKQGKKLQSQREITVLKLLNHPSILKICNIYETKQHIFIVMEYMENGELFDYLVKKQFIMNSEALLIFQQLIYALEYCHNHFICHRDLKLENILLDKFGNVKIGDFGMVGFLKNSSLLKTFCGSPQYVAPEIIEGKEYDGTKSDIWSCGVILYILLVGKLPFEGQNTQSILQKIMEEELEFPENFPIHQEELLKGMLMKEPEKRYSIDQIKKNTWFCSNFPLGFVPPSAVLRQRFIRPILNKTISNQVLLELKTFGWDETNIRDQLKKEEPNMEKIFYILFYRKFKKKLKGVIKKDQNSQEKEKEHEKEKDDNDDDEKNSIKKLRLENRKLKRSNSNYQSYSNDFTNELFWIHNEKEKEKEKEKEIEKEKKRSQNSSKNPVQIQLQKKSKTQSKIKIKLKKEPKTTYQWFSNDLNRRRGQNKKRKTPFQNCELQYHKKFIQSKQFQMENLNKSFSKNHKVSVKTKKEIMFIMLQCQIVLNKYGFEWKFPNIFTLKARRRGLKIRFKITKSSISSSDSEKELYFIYKRGEPIEFIQICNQFVDQMII
ncbi:protein kinase [Anaeramoeba ignava]|uniref:Protein kinase n=1 Tax=Anaeramoeba ignava TaxID=1746090 RepID=A0A9Q0R9S0_ANAIG|nr:protein kinase [Anaeramoeba ignava]